MAGPEQTHVGFDLHFETLSYNKNSKLYWLVF